MVTFSLNTTTVNESMRSGKFGETIQAILGDIKPEAVYFGEKDGVRTGWLVVDLEDASQIPAIAEPFFLAFNASINIAPVMVPEDLGKAGPAIKAAVSKFG